MRYVAAYLLASLGGNNSPQVADIKKILSSVGIDVDEASANKVIKELSGKDIKELIAAGKEKLASVPSAGAVAVSAGGAAPAAAAAGGDSAPAEAKKKEEKKEESEESDDDMGFGLFD